MKTFFKKSLAASALGLALGLASTASSAYVVGGVDFGVQGNTGHLETTTVAETLINGNGQTLTGYGQINTVNGNINYASGGAQRLFFVFTNYISNDFIGGVGGSVDFTGGVINVYLGSSAVNLLNQSSAANLALISALTPWAQLVGHVSNFAGADGTDTLEANGTLTGTTLSFTGAGLLDVNAGFGLADVYNYLNANTIADLQGGFADIVFTSSGNNQPNRLNTFDNLAGCATGQAAAGAWCLAGSADLSGGTVIPEPASMALIGLGLLGLGAMRRRSKV